MVANTLNTLPVLRFDGSDDFLAYNLPVSGLSGMTIFLISKNSVDHTPAAPSNANNTAIFWNETASGGTVYLGPFQDEVAYRFGTTQVGNQPVYTRPSNIGNQFSMTVSRHDGASGTDTLFVNGAQVHSESGKLANIAQTQPTGNIARGWNNNTFFNGDIVEVLVYDRALSAAERQQTEQYLNEKYSLYPVPTVAFNAVSSSGVESVTTVNIPVSLSVATEPTVTIDFAVTGGTATGSGTDYTLASGTLTFATGQTTRNIAVTINNDSLDELDETIQITLSNPVNATLGAPTVHTYTITDDDAAPTVTLSISGAAMAEAAAAATITATLSAVSGQDVTVNFGFSGTATLNNDYTASASVITILAGATTGSITLTAIQDAIDEPSETIVVDIISATNATTLTPQQVTATIIDDDAMPTVTLSIANASMAEASGVATVTAALSAVSSLDVTINLTFSGTATFNTDYSASSAVITIPGGGLTGGITLTAIQDTLNEANETIVVGIGSITNATELGTQQATATIVDDDAMPTVSLSIAGTSIAETGGIATVTATLSAISGQAVTVGLAFSGSATFNVDYSPSSTSIVIPAGSLSGSITLAAISDTIDEPNETIAVTMGLVSNATAAGLQQVTATIIDDDGPNVAFNLAIDDTPDPVQPGAEIAYTLTYGNATTANQTASQVTLRNTIPADTTFVSASNGGAFAAGLVTWTLGDLAPGASGTRTLVVQVNTPLPNGTILTAQATLQDNASTSINASQNTTVQSAPILALSMTDSPDPVQAGGQLAYTVNYSNAGNANQTAPSATLGVPLPANATFVSASNAGALVGGIATWSLGDVPPGTSGTRTLVVQVNSPLPNGTILNAQVSLQDTIGNSAAASQSSTVNSSPLLALTVIDSPDPVLPGGEVTYTFTVSNASAANQTATGVTLTDTIPANATFVSASDGGVFANGIVTWTIASLAPGTSVTRTLVVKLGSTVLGGTLVANIATIGNGQGQSASAQANTTVAYTGGGGFVPNNYATTNAESASVGADTTPASSSGFSVAAPAEMAPGSVPLQAPAPALVTPRAPTTPLMPPNQAPNFTQPNFGQPRCSTMLSLSGSHSPQPAFSGATVTYTFNYINLSTLDTMRDVALHSFLPKEMTFVSASDRGVAASDNSAYWHLGDLAPGARGTRSVVARVGQLEAETILLVNNHAMLENGVDNCAQTIEAATIQAVSSTDKDGDGFPDEDEKRCGANPLDAASTCFSLELTQNTIRVQRGREVSLKALVKGRFRFAGEVTVTPNNSLNGAVWQVADSHAKLGPKKMSEEVSFGLYTTSNTPLGLHQVPIWAVSGKMATTQILTIEVAP
ncbi:MAG: DUF11 domain-containing protein [Deltaproteobacteria bacterium]|nr:DUF11 domain-containing protein [Deltaproteobacteria bacterium]